MLATLIAQIKFLHPAKMKYGINQCTKYLFVNTYYAMLAGQHYIIRKELTNIN